ncbi:MAG: winged helix-turn-helix domain-containing protein [Pseudomonadota bacterium]
MPRTAAKAAELEVLSLPQIAYAQLRDDILTGRHEAGSPLRQEELAQKMGVSRVPLREALRRLEVEGLVVQRAAPRLHRVVTGSRGHRRHLRHPRDARGACRLSGSQAPHRRGCCRGRSPAEGDGRAG